jgi:hypothetical protein
MSPAARKVAVAALRGGAYALVLAFLGYELWRVRHGVGADLRRVGWWNALAATALAVAGGIPSFIGWRVLLATMGTRLPLRTGIWLYFLAGVARYLPGGVWPTMAHAALARPLGEPPGRLAGAMAGSQALGIVSGVAVSLLALPRLVAASPLWWLLLPVLLALLIPVAVPRLLSASLGLAMRLLRRGGQPPALPGRRTLWAVTALMVTGWLITGLHITVLAVALGASPGRALILGIGGFALSVVAGVCAVVLPSGLGVREVVLGLTLASLAGGPALITIIALSRVLTTLADLASTAAVLGWMTCTNRGRLRPAATTTIADRQPEGVSPS